MQQEGIRLSDLEGMTVSYALTHFASTGMLGA